MFDRDDNTGLVVLAIGAILMLYLMLGGKPPQVQSGPTTTTITIIDDSSHTCILGYCPSMR